MWHKVISPGSWNFLFSHCNQKLKVMGNPKPWAVFRKQIGKKIFQWRHLLWWHLMGFSSLCKDFISLFMSLVKWNLFIGTHVKNVDRCFNYSLLYLKLKKYLYIYFIICTFSDYYPLVPSFCIFHINQMHWMHGLPHEHKRTVSRFPPWRMKN